MLKLNHVKTGLSLVTMLGTTKIIGDIVKNNVHDPSKFQRVCIFVAKEGIAAVIAEKVSVYTNSAIDEGVKTYKDIKSKAEG